MISKNLGVSFLAGALALCLPLAAQSDPGLYVGGNLALTILQDSTLNPSGGGANVEVETDAGYGISGILGYRVNDNVRTEVELAWRENSNDKALGGGGPVNGDTSSLAGLFNLFYDIDLDGPLTPYVGIGIGVARVELDSSFAGIGDDDAVFAYQVATGVTFAVTDAMDFLIGYRFMGTQDAELTTNGGTPFDMEYDSHNVETGIRFWF